jgi:hypothetical protein
MKRTAQLQAIGRRWVSSGAILAAGAFLAAGTPLGAQSTWSSVGSGVAVNLWGVCHGGGQFVAVGEQGTILTSQDGTAWTRQTSGTAVWLTSVAYGLGHYLAVGAGGTVISSRDARTWTTVGTGQPAAPRERLNVVVFFRDEFRVAGEHNNGFSVRLPPRIDWMGAERTAGPWWRGYAVGADRLILGGEMGLAAFNTTDPYLHSPLTIEAPPDLRGISGVVFENDVFTAVGTAGSIATSRDGLSWRRQESNTRSDLHGLAVFNNALVAAGETGTVLTSDLSRPWTRVTVPSSELLLAVAAHERVAVIVGGTGTILRASADILAPLVAEGPVGVQETLGGAAGFQVRASGSPPLAFQWSRNGQPLVGETRSTLTRTPLTAEDAGDYAVTVSNAAGSVTSSAARLTLLPAPAAIVDSAFQADSGLTGIPSTLLVMPDGRILVANGRPGELVRLQPDGRLDAAWPGTVFATPTGAAGVTSLTLQSDGRVLAAGSFSAVNGQPRASIARFTTDGTLDASFVPDPAAVVAAVQGLSVDSAGRILLALGTSVPVRLLADGRRDAEFRPQPLPPAITSTGQPRDWRVVGVAAAPDGGSYLVSNVNLSVTAAQLGRVMTSQLHRLDVGGGVMEGFAPHTWSGGLSGLRVLNDGSVGLVEYRSQGGMPLPLDGRVVRLRPDGTAFPGHRRPTIGSPRTSLILPDGRVLYTTDALPGPLGLTALGESDSGFTGGIGAPSLLAPAADGRVLVAGSFSLYNGKAAHRIARLNTVPNETPQAPQILALQADRTTVAYDERITVRATVTGSAALTYEWIGPVGPNGVIHTAEPALTFAFTRVNEPRSLRLIVRNPRGAAEAAPLVFTVLPDPPIFTAQETRVSAQTGKDVTLWADLNARAGTLEYDWRHNGALLERTGYGWGEPTLLRPGVTAADAGRYTLTVSNILGATATSQPIPMTIDDTSRFANLSSRASVGDGEAVIIAGFTVPGRSVRRVLVRGIGPGLTRFGVTHPVSDPQIQLYLANGAERAGSFADGWHESSLPAFVSTGAFPLEAGSNDAAFISILDPGSYTVVLSSKTGASGTALIEVYEYDDAASRMLNLSTRMRVAQGTPAISGFVVSGPVPKRVLMRAVGPGLTRFGVATALPNPRLTLMNSDGAVVAANDDWADSSAADIAAASAAAGAFPLAPESRDAALVREVAPGNYTLIAETEDANGGVVLLEIYELP